jgi:uncharacterized membrane protein YjjP (DUF1212 family)
MNRSSSRLPAALLSIGALFAIVALVMILTGDRPRNFTSVILGALILLLAGIGLHNAKRRRE